MGIFTKSMVILLLAVSTPLLYRQFATDKTVKFMSSYYSNYKTIDQFLRKSAGQLDQAKGYVPDAEQMKELVDRVQKKIKPLVESFTSRKEGPKQQQEKLKTKEGTTEEKADSAKVRLTNCQGEAHQVRLWSKQELSQYDGSGAESDVYLAFLGVVYNVTINAQHYAKGAEYNIFAGRDATRAFITGNFTHDLNDDISDVDLSLYSHVESWASFYSSSYQVVGRLEGKFYDSQGCGTKELARVQQMFNKLEQDKSDRREQEKDFPECNSEWNSDTQEGRVWCSAKSGGVERDWIGVPRIYNNGDSNRCACFNKDNSNANELSKFMSVYPGCDSEASECSIVQ